MKGKNEQYQIIVNTLTRSGVFAISDIESNSTLSRESIGKILHKLVDDNVLKKTAKKGSGVKYKLAINNKAIAFLFEYIEQLNIDDFARAWGVSVDSAKKYIKKFIDDGIIDKFGAPPQKIIYIYISQKDESIFLPEQKRIIEKYYVYTTPEGRLLKGVKGFIYWANNKSNRKDIENLAREYINTRKKYYNNQSSVLIIDATNKLRHVFGDEVYIEKLFHRDFDALPVFGKTALSQMVRTAKSGRTNKALMTKIVEKIQESVNMIISEYDINYVGFIPPTVARKTQLMSFITKRLNIPCKKVSFSKVKSLIPIQQKSLKKVEDRMLNAQKTIIIDDAQKYNNILLIDDVTGSVATLNETAKKIIVQGIAKKVYAFTITGSAKAGAFDVISEA
jgi:DNA-binding Lrp family transcriptional regulator